MEMWELFLKGLSKTIEEFVVTMVERGKAEQGSKKESAPLAPQKQSEVGTEKVPQKKRTIPFRELGELEGQILSVIERYPNGITLKEVASEMGMQWHFLRIPLRQLTLENKVIKDEKLYTIAGSPKTVSNAAPEAPAIEPEVVSEPVVVKAPEPAILKQPELISFDEPVEKKHQAKPRRRVVDAKELEKKPEESSVLKKMSVRDRERLRYRILTALRGRPEGLTLDKLAAVLGMELELLVPNLEQLQTETKIVNDDSGKYRLP